MSPQPKAVERFDLVIVGGTGDPVRDGCTWDEDTGRA